MTTPQKYTGGCHCGQIQYEVTADLNQVISCNCSVCTKKGALLSFVGADQFKLLSGKDAVSDYQFNKKVIHHLFCRTCGVESFASGTAPDGRQMYAINVRCLEGVDLAALRVTPVDGKSL
ncbi:GFA family protein [Stigmatella aurantiaca]|uniref:Glutathione-dependent formaldehyde-activating protein, GFA n=2 Tax=Stigmatella aurantiaca TaxID=41 RepID=Q097S3_STIAD|nr:GFA family protein [Stigmatella aurantiaca]ADO68420.1 Glutathione-dependent formaldehyde-activating protein, GFA [Stigmatella aurantiaca DW4/3-1]EAU68015.1 glutathione-dependent formaldehyde-activating, GFA [Stigmatella aurantiaca DW4/3-1]